MKVIIDEMPKSIYACLFIKFDFKKTHAPVCVLSKELCVGVESCPYLKEINKK